MTHPDPTTQSHRAHFRKLLGENRDMVLVFLNAQIGELFASTDEALLDFAERAESNAMQGRFYEAMGTVRRKRTDIEHLYRQEIGEAFDRFGLAGGGGTSAQSFREVQGIELALIEPDEMEESVAADNLIMKAKSSYHAQLYALGQRLAVINEGRKMDERDIPSGPSHLVNAFRDAIRSLDVDIKAKIVLYALYDKFVVRQLKGMYDEFNGNLKNAGILPNLKPSYTRNAGDSAAPSADEPQTEYSDEPPDALEPDTQATQPLGEELFDSIIQLLAARRHGGTPASPGGRTSPSRAGPSAGAATPGSGRPSAPGSPAQGGAPSGASVAPREKLISAVEHLRPASLSQARGVMGDLDNLPRVAVDPGFLDKVKHALAHERDQLFNEVSRDEMHGIDADTIDLIGMLFEYMLNDPLLPNVAKALLSHLHTPYLKLALIDRQLLVDSEHPARLLLDQLVEAGGQWVLENDIKRGIFPQMQTVVDRVLKEFTDNVALFSDLLEYFQAAADEHRRKADAIEQRAQDTAKGREKLQVAKKRAAQEMKARVEQGEMPDSVRQFLTQTWVDRLVFILLRHPEGELSEDWKDALQVADNLVWIFEAKLTDGDRHGLVEVCHSLRADIESALESLGGYHQHHVEEVLRLVKDPTNLLDWQSQPSKPRSPPPKAAARRPATAGERPMPGKPIPPRTPSPSPAPTPKTERPGPASQTLFFEDELTTTSDLSEQERQMLDKLQKLKFGTWFELRDRDGPPRRVKLSWLSPLTSTCMFVDRSGIQAEIKTLAELARLLVSGTAMLIPKPKHPFVERAMMAIKRTLQGGEPSHGE